MAQNNITEKNWIDFQQFFDFALSYHKSEPVIANIIALSVPAIIIALIVNNNLKHKRNNQTQDKKNIMSYKVKLKKHKSKSKKKR